MNEPIDPDDEEDIVLSELDDGELVEQMHDDLYNGLKEEIEEGTHILLGRGWSPSRVLDEALVAPAEDGTPRSGAHRCRERAAPFRSPDPRGRDG